MKMIQDFIRENRRREEEQDVDINDKAQGSTSMEVLLQQTNLFEIFKEVHFNVSICQIYLENYKEAVVTLS